VHGNDGFGVQFQNAANHNTISGSVISGQNGNGVVITGTGTSNNTVQGSYIGTDPTGASAVPNTNGVYIESGATNNTIGGTTAATRDVISGNSSDGVDIMGHGTTGNVVEGDYIGVTANGSSALANALNGVSVFGTAADNTIGGSATGSGNVLSGNYAGVNISDPGTIGNLVEGDLVGTDFNGAHAVPSYIGVFIQNDAASNTIGGTAASTRDVVSGNSLDGVHIVGCAALNVVEGDYIGVSASGAAGLGDGSNGVAIFGGATLNTIGGTVSGSGNVISANARDGVYISDVGTSDNVVEGDDIGTDSGGTHALPNYNGVYVQYYATNNIIGGTVGAARDVISGNTYAGVQLVDSGTTGNVVEGDYIGVTSGGSAALANNQGVVIQSKATNNTIGGSAAARNVLSGNSQDGVYIIGSGTSGNLVAGNYIGVAAGGSTALANGQNGVAVFSCATNNTVGGTATGSGNVISGNAANGVYISDSGTTGNLVAGNDIGTDSTGAVAVPNYDGVLIQNAATSNTIGAATGTARQVISGNTWDGVHIVGSGTNSNIVEGNFIGVTASGSTALGNGASGVAIYARASNNTLGGTATGAGNVISSSRAYYGVYLSDSGTTGNLIAGDLIGTDSTGAHALANPTGVYIGNGASNNTVGGTTASARNVISGNTVDGVHVVNGATGNLVEGNYIGVTAGGTAALGNGQSGVSIYGGATNNTIGGTVAGSFNVISGNGTNGVYLGSSGTTGNLVAGDYIGTDALGQSALKNSNDGVLIAAGACYNTIGAPNGGANLIDYNGNNGIELDASSAFGNSIQGDTIDLNGANGVFFSGAASNSVFNCIIGSNKRWGILDQGINNMYGNNTIRNNGSGGIGT
jgi:titin